MTKNYYLSFSDRSCWRLESCDHKTDFLADSLARICRMNANPPNGINQILNCSIFTFDHLDDFRKKYPELTECGRKHFFRAFFDEKSENSWLFFNMDEMNNETMKILFTTNIAKVLQLQMLNRGNCAPCHCALVEINGIGAVICASGDTGKSTSARRITEAGHKAYSDDYALIFKQSDRITAQPMPTWSNLLSGDTDYTADCSGTIKLSGIFFLKQSRYDLVEPLSKFSAVKHLNAALQDLFAGRTVSDMPTEFKHKLRTGIFDFANHVIEQLPAYSLHATLHGKFWEKMDEKLKLES